MFHWSIWPATSQIFTDFHTTIYISTIGQMRLLKQMISPLLCHIRKILSQNRECAKLQNKKFISVDTISLFNESQDATKIWSGKKRKWNKMTFIFYGLCYSVTVNSIPKITLGFWDIRWLGWEGKIIWPSRLDIYTYQTCVHNTEFRNRNQVFIIHWIFVIGSKLFWVNYGVFLNKYIKR